MRGRRPWGRAVVVAAVDELAAELELLPVCVLPAGAVTVWVTVTCDAGVEEPPHPAAPAATAAASATAVRMRDMWWCSVKSCRLPSRRGSCKLR